MYNGVILLKFTKIVSILLSLYFSLLCMNIREDDCCLCCGTCDASLRGEGGGGGAVTNSCLGRLMN